VNEDPPPGSELSVFLWVMATLIASMELVWLFFDRAFSR
jgi:hypothetical protein